jgi:hypothetical protein
MPSYSDSFRNATKYLGQDYRFAPSYVRTRNPTPNDLKPKEQQGFYPITSLWTNTSNNSVWILVNFTTLNGQIQAIWTKINSGAEGPVLDIGVPNGNSPIVPDSNGLVNYTQTGQITITGSNGGTGAQNINFNVSAISQIGGLSGTTPITPDSNGLVNYTSTGSTIVITGSSGGTGLQNINFDTSISNPFNSIVIQTFTSSGTYTPTTGMKYCIIECLGGGGGGGGTGAGAGSAGGGGSGEYSRGVFSFGVISPSQTVTIGLGGSGGIATPTNGSTGGTTSVGVLITSVGGSGGQNPGSNSGAPGSGGTGGAGGQIRCNGMIASYGMFVNGVNAGGVGANSQYGQGGGASAGGDFNGGNASGYGSGGGGSVGTSRVGGNGSPGIVIITEYISS